MLRRRKSGILRCRKPRGSPAASRAGSFGSVIAGATKPEQIEQNVAAAAKLPSPAVIAEIDAITA